MLISQLTPLISERFLRDEKYRNGHLRIINPLPYTRILGVHIPELKTLAKTLAGQPQFPETLHQLKTEAKTASATFTYEEKMVWGLMLNYIQVPVEKRLEYLADFIPFIDNWAICDTFCCAAKWKCPTERLWEFLNPYFHSTREFEVRFAIVLSMCRLMEKNYLDKIFRQFDTLDFDQIHLDYISEKVAKKDIRPEEKSGHSFVKGQPPYYVRMGVAWFLATALAKYPEETRTYVHRSLLPEDVIRLYVRKARESFRTRNISPFLPAPTQRLV